MGTVIRAELSKKNKYWIERHRYYELKHFCMQYPIWKKVYSAIEGARGIAPERILSIVRNMPSDPTAKAAIAKLYYSDKIDLVERVAKEADPELSSYILKGVTEGVSYEYLKTRLEIPCCKDTYYDRYRRFFWLLSKERQ